MNKKAEELFALMTFKYAQCSKDGSTPVAFYMRSEDFLELWQAATFRGQPSGLLGYKGIPIVAVPPDQFAIRKDKRGLIVRVENIEEIMKVFEEKDPDLEITPLREGDVWLEAEPPPVLQVDD